MSDLTVRDAPETHRSLHPSCVAIWPVETGGYGIDLTYHGATGYTDAEDAERLLREAGLTTSFRQELDSAWTVRFGPLPRDHIRAVLDHFAWVAPSRALVCTGGLPHGAAAAKPCDLTTSGAPGVAARAVRAAYVADVLQSLGHVG